jgi:hypothetical protein
MNTAGTPARCHCNWNSLTSIGDVMAILIRRNVSRDITVMVLIGLLAPGIFARRPPYFAQVGKSQIKVARAQIDAFDKALDQYDAKDAGHWRTPTSFIAAPARYAQAVSSSWPTVSSSPARATVANLPPA